MSSTKHVEMWAVLNPRPEKLQLVVDVMHEIAKWSEKNEPGYLEMKWFTEPNPDDIPDVLKTNHPDLMVNPASPKVFVYQKFVDEAAMHFHAASEKYQAFVKLAKEENVFGRPHDIVMVSQRGGFVR